MTTQPFSSRTKERAKMKRSSVTSIRHRVTTYYRSLYDITFGKNMFLVFFASLTQPPLTFAKGATYVLGTLVVSTGVYASIAPDSFVRTSSVVKEQVETIFKTTIDVFTPPVSPSPEQDIREDKNEVFCDGERRDAEECAQRMAKEDRGITGENEGEADEREDKDEVFCDGERRDAEDCAKRMTKQELRTTREDEVETDDREDDEEDVRREDSEELREDEQKADVREDKDEVFCDGERRDAEDCAKRMTKQELDTREDEQEIDEREDEDEVFCDGERRDAEDCAKRLAKEQDEGNDTEEESTRRGRGGDDSEDDEREDDD